MSLGVISLQSECFNKQIWMPWTCVKFGWFFIETRIYVKIDTFSWKPVTKVRYHL